MNLSVFIRKYVRLNMLNLSAFVRRHMRLSTLVVMMPPRDPAVPPREWQLPELPFLLLDRNGRTQRVGRAVLSLLPRATSTVLLIAARDLLMLATVVPPLKGQRLRHALPNIVEDYLIHDPQTCHFALDPQRLDEGKTCIAVIDRDWFHYLIEGFAATGHRQLKAVPITRCLHGPEGLATEADGAKVSSSVCVCVFGPAMATASAPLADAGVRADTAQPVELAIVRGALAEGLAVPAASVPSTLAALAREAPVSPDSSVRSLMLVDVPGGPSARTGVTVSLPDAQRLSFETLARHALTCRFDLCQFEFEARPWRLDRTLLHQLRVPLAFVAASLAVAIVGANVQWLMMAHERDALKAKMTEQLLDAFPKTTVVLDPDSQMTRQLQQLRTAAGSPSSGDFLVLADGLARSLGPIAANGIASLDYHDQRLDVTFKPGIAVDPALAQRLARNGLTGSPGSSAGKWTIRSAS